MADTKEKGGRISALDALFEGSIKKLEDGSVVVNSAMMDALRTERARELRRATVSTVPSTPKYVDRQGRGVPRGSARYRAMAFDTLRAIRERSPLIQPIHAARHLQVSRLAQRWSGTPGDVGWRVVHKDHTDPRKETPEAVLPYIAKAEEMLLEPNADMCPTTAQLFMLLWEDLATINRPVLEVLYSVFDRDKILGFRPVDGALIWPTLDWVQRWHRTTNTQLDDDPDVQIALASARMDFDLHGTEYVLVRDGMVEAAYPSTALVVGQRVTRTDVRWSGYQPSTVEIATAAILASLDGWDYNHNMFTKGMLAEFAFGISGDVHPTDVDAFLDQLRESTQGVDNAWSPPVITLPHEGVLQRIQLKDNPKDMGFETWISLTDSRVLACYRADPSMVNSKPWDGGGSPGLGATNRNMEIALAKEEGLQGDMSHIVGIIERVIRRIHPDLRLMVEYGDFDPQKAAAIIETRCRTTMTRNEGRMEEGDPPLGFYLTPEEWKNASDEDKARHDRNPWNMPTDPSFPNALAQAQAADNPQQQPPGMPPGMDPAAAMGGAPQAGPQDDGFGNARPPGPQPPQARPPVPGGGGPPAPNALQPATKGGHAPEPWTVYLHHR